MGTIQLLPTYKISASSGNIAFDAVTTPGTRSNSGTSWTVSHTTSGTNRFLVVNIGVNNVSGVTGITYGGVSMTQIGTTTTNGAGSYESVWGLINPASGANNVVVTTGVSCVKMMHIASFTGVNQTTAVGAVTTDGPSTTTSFTQTVTTTSDNSWLVQGGMGRSGNTVTAGSNTTVRAAVEALAFGLFLTSTSTAQTPTGSKSLNVTSTSQEFNGIMFELITS